MDYPSVSIIIPTLNSQFTLKDCLESIKIQDYPRDKLEIVIADGGSTDNTLNIIKDLNRAMNLHLVHNRLKTGEAGKAEGLKHTHNDIIAFIDSDNMLPEANWLKKMTEPFYNPDIIASEPLYYTYRRSDGFITRYSALIGMNDPLCLFLGNYDRYCLLTNRWTEVAVKQQDKDSYIEVSFLNERLPTIGANGFFIRREELLNCPVGDYLFDVDIISYLYQNKPRIKVAKVKTGIIHIFAKTLGDFFSKQKRRFMDYTYYKTLGLRLYQWQGIPKLKIIRFILYTLLGVPIFAQAIRGYALKKDYAWFFHPVACWITIYVYSCLFLRNLWLPLTPKKR